VVQSIAEREDDSFVDAHGVTIHYYRWRAPEPRAVVQLLHGLGEHAQRYEPFAQALVAAGYTVVADDHRGHGRTGTTQYPGEPGRLGRLGPGGFRAVVEDVHLLTAIIRSGHPDVPLVLLGHSWGSVIAQVLVDTRSADYDGAVLSGTAYRTVRHMRGGDFNARHRHLGTTGHEWLSRDAAVAQAFADDELTFSAEAVRLFGVADALRMLGRPARRLERDLPLLVQVGSDDPFGGRRSAELLAAAYRRRSGLTDVELLVYPEARHEIYNETNRDEVVADLVAWLDARMPGR
jgi:alpha-beta hydrolase superfamily lysophospholipase